MSEVTYNWESLVKPCLLTVCSTILGEESQKVAKLSVKHFQILKTRAKAADVVSTLSEFLADNNISWENVVGICTYGAQAMTGLTVLLKWLKKKTLT